VLLRAKLELENRVSERTSDLAALNKRLLREIEARKQTEQEVRKSREELRSLSEHLQQIREKDRADVARDVHDQLGQALSAVVIDLHCLREQLPRGDDGRARNQVQEIEGRIGDTMRSVREICRKLRPPILDDLGLPAAIKWHLREFQEKAGIECIAAIDGEIPEYRKEVGLVIFRIYQEAITNILRHARATRVGVTLRNHKQQLILEVTDNGIGISAEEVTSPLSLGLLGIRERVRFWGGKLLLTGAPGKGTVLRVSIPLRPTKAAPKRSALRADKKSEGRPL
jgi:signal transduction histidine kinase